MGQEFILKSDIEMSAVDAQKVHQQQLCLQMGILDGVSGEGL